MLAWFLLGPCVQSLLPVTYTAVDTLDIALRLGMRPWLAPYWALIAIFTASQRACARLALFASGRHWPFYLSKTAAAPTRAALSKVS